MGDAEQELVRALREIEKRPGWANARDSVTSYRFLYSARAKRCMHAAEAEACFTVEDVAAAMARLKAQRPLGEPISDASGFAAAGSVLAGRGITAGGSAPPQMMPNPPPAPPPPPQESQWQCVEVEEAEMLDVSEQHAPSDGKGDGMDPVYAALLIACREEGYDKDNETRKELVAILSAMREGGADFPPNIMDRVIEKTKLSTAKAQQVLKPQVVKVLSAMREAVQREEERLAELRRLEEERRLEELRKENEEHRHIQQTLQARGPCPMGFSWYRCGGGWRCTGGSHYKSDAELGMCGL